MKKLAGEFNFCTYRFNVLVGPTLHDSQIKFY